MRPKVFSVCVPKLQQISDTNIQTRTQFRVNLKYRNHANCITLAWRFMVVERRPWIWTNFQLDRVLCFKYASHWARAQAHDVAHVNQMGGFLVKLRRTLGAAHNWKILVEASQVFVGWVWNWNSVGWALLACDRSFNESFINYRAKGWRLIAVDASYGFPICDWRRSFVFVN